jgi:hypothetical protein
VSIRAIILDALQIPDPGRAVAGCDRSSRWPKVMRAYLAGHPTCEACGSKHDLNVHHVLPFHLDPRQELEPKNLVTLCRFHHFDLGHLGDWKAFFPGVREIAALHLLAYKLRRALMAQSRREHRTRKGA